jgi:hypothetical protein
MIMNLTHSPNKLPPYLVSGITRYKAFTRTHLIFLVYPYKVPKANHKLENNLSPGNAAVSLEFIKASFRASLMQLMQDLKKVRTL